MLIKSNSDFERLPNIRTVRISYERPPSLQLRWFQSALAGLDESLGIIEDFYFLYLELLIDSYPGQTVHF